MTKKEFAEHKKRVAALPKPVLRWESLGKQVYHLSCGLTQVALVNRDGDGRYWKIWESDNLGNVLSGPHRTTSFKEARYGH